MLLMALMPIDALANDNVKKLLVRRYVITENGDTIPESEEIQTMGSETLSEQNTIDSTVVLIPEKNYGRFDRGLYAHLVVPKGLVACGLQASYGEIGTSDLQMLNIISDLDFAVKAYSVKPYLQYFYKHNKAVGLRFGFSRSEIDLNSFALDFDEDINFNIRDVSYRTQNTSVALFHRNYIGLDKSRRFAVFNEVSLGYSGGTGSFSRLFNDQPKVTQSKSNEFRLDFSPGLCVFIQEKVAFNMSFGIFGWYWKRETQVTNGVEEGVHSASGANFKINLFNLNMGVSIFI